MNYSKIDSCSITDGPGIRVSLFVSGCRIGCKGCFNKVAQDFKFGEEFTDETMANILSHLNNDYVSGLTVLGGEPMDVKNVDEVSNIVSIVKKMFPDKNIWLYSGYLLEQLLDRKCILTEYVLKNIDVLVDGPFVEYLKDPSLRFRGSSNQRILQRGIDF